MNIFKYIFPAGKRGPVRLIDKSKLKPGLIMSVRSYGMFGRGIRYAEGKWQRRISKFKLIPYKAPWGSHNALVLANDVVGEALIKEGNIVTLVDNYNKMIKDGKVEVRFYEVINVITEQENQATNIWIKKVQGKKYDYQAFPRLILKSLVYNWQDSHNRILRYIGSVGAGSKHRFWCTQAVEIAYKHMDIFCGDKNPTPMHVEIRAGELPEMRVKRITLKNISKDVLC